MLGKVVGFIPTKRPDLAKSFYAETLGLRFLADEPFALVFESSGTMLRIQKLPDSQPFTPGENTLIGWEIDDIESEVKALSQKGVPFQRFPGMEQDAFGIWKSPSGAKVAWFKDPDGNNLSLTQWP